MNEFSREIFIDILFTIYRVNEKGVTMKHYWREVFIDCSKKGFIAGTGNTMLWEYTNLSKT